MIVPLHDADGRYRGFVAGTTVYGRNGRPLGFVEDGRVFNSRGDLIGEWRGHTIVTATPHVKRASGRNGGGRIRTWLADRLGCLGSPADPFDRLERI
jgi:hypothetical protein